LDKDQKMKRFFELARRISFKSQYKHQMGALIVKKGKVMGLGFNSTKTHPRASNPWKMIHAEMSAILNSRMEDFTGCSIYIYRETPTGKLGTSYPCKHCKRMIESLNFKDIHYTNYDGYQWEIL
jgi:deoxycytidylate deaminase